MTQYPLIKIVLITVMTTSLAACGPMAAVGAVGSAITRTANKGVPDQAPVNPARLEQQRKDIAVANVNLGVAYLQQGQYAKALQKLERAKLAKADYAPTYLALGLLYQRTKEPEKADPNFQRSLDLEPNNPSFLNTYASFLCNQDFEKAEALFLKAANNPLYTTPEHALSNAGTCASKNNQRNKAEEYFRQALERNPRVPPALIQMAEISYDSNDYLSARDYLNRYLKVAKHTAKSLWIGIQVENELGDMDKVSSYVMLLRNQFPDTEEAKLLNQL